jgi:uncharacterized protein (DUF305 family)
MKRFILIALCAALFSGCAKSPQGNSEFSSDDIKFAEMMIPHHQQAIEMSNLAPSNTTNPDVLRIAQKISAAQSPEIELMKSWTGVNPSAHVGHTMEGMLSESEMVALLKATDNEFDQLFLEGMIKHHEGAIEMAQKVTNSKNSLVANLSVNIISAQQLEISTMKALLLQMTR